MQHLRWRAKQAEGGTKQLVNRSGRSGKEIAVRREVRHGCAERSAARAADDASVTEYDNSGRNKQYLGPQTGT